LDFRISQRIATYCRWGGNLCACRPT